MGKAGMPLASRIALNKEWSMKKLALLLVLPLVLGACGDDDSANGAPISASVALDDFSFTPASVTLAAGVEVSVDVSNIGGIQHSWVVVKQGVAVTTSAEVTPDRVLAASADLDGGASDSISFTLPEAGTYQVVCHIPGHIEAGMVGTVEASG
jgi:uncharacterized cupredoxin-like copper-binding protein